MDAASPFQGGNTDSRQPGTRQRRRLNLKPRDDKRAAELQRKSSLLTATSSLFGDSKPREAIIADRDGKTEEEIVREEVRKERLQVRLPPEQNQERLSGQAAVAEIEEQMKQEADEKKLSILKAELAARQQKLDRLLERFAKEALSEREKHAGQRERYKPTRGSTDGAGVHVGMATPAIPGVGGGFHRPYPNQYVPHGGPNGGYDNGNGGGRHTYNGSDIDTTTGGQVGPMRPVGPMGPMGSMGSMGPMPPMGPMGPMPPMGYGGGGPRPPAYAHGVPPGGQPYMVSPVGSGHALRRMNIPNHMNAVPPRVVPVPYHGGGYPGSHGPVPVQVPGMAPGVVPGMGQQVGFYQSPPAGVGMGGEIEMDFSNL